MTRKTKFHFRTRREPRDKQVGDLPPNPHALIVEDEPKVASLYMLLLSEMGYTCHSAHDFRSALVVVQNTIFDLIVLDLRLPDKPGDELVRMLRASGNETPILVVTGAEDPQREAAVLNAGADAYLRKPFENATLVAHVRAIERRPRSMRKLVRFDGDFVVDPARSEIGWLGLRVELPPLKWRVTWVLATNAGAHFSTRRLCLEVYGRNSAKLEKSMYEHVEPVETYVERITDGGLIVASEQHQGGYVLKRTQLQTLT